jgi:hypothetical protein
MGIMEVKKCSKCEIEKEFHEFNKAKNKKFGLSSLCKECHKEYRRDHYVKNKEKVLKQVKEYREQNPNKYIRKKQNKQNKKAGRTNPIKCGECDNIVYVTKKDIEDSVIKYCSNACRYKNMSINSAYTNYLKDIKTRAKRKGVEFNLTENFIKNLLVNKQNNKCAYTGIEIYVNHKYRETTPYDTASLDRIDSNKGYTEDNVQWVMLGINYMKLNFSEDDVHKTLKLIKENY